MDLNKAEIRKLVFIKFLYNQAVDVSQKGMPYSSMALLLFHDAIELFLEAAATSYDISSDKLPFMGYWEPLSQKLRKENKKPVSYKEPLRKLNKDRVRLKHKGLYPSQANLEAHRANTLDFFRDNCGKLFGIEYEDISLLKLIPYEETQTHMREASKFIEKKDLVEASLQYAIAFDILVKEYKKDKRGFYGENLFELYEKPKFKETNYLRGGPGELREDLKEFTDQIETAFDEIQDVLEILALNINYKDYMRFKSIVPKIYIDGAGNYQQGYGKKENIEMDDLSFCKNFLLETSLSLSQDDFKSYPNEEMKRNLFK